MPEVTAGTGAAALLTVIPVNHEVTAVERRPWEWHADCSKPGSRALRRVRVSASARQDRMTMNRARSTTTVGRVAPIVTRALAGSSVFTAFLLLPQNAHASLLSPELEDKLATGIALFVIFIVPAVLIVLFWMVHILPEKIAHQRNHPQFEAIRTLCLLSLIFGGLLWPVAWVWAYSKPVMHKLAYGTDQGDHGGEHE
jgi:hypothetical protein